MYRSEIGTLKKCSKLVVSKNCTEMHRQQNIKKICKLSIRSHCDPGVDSASKRNEYQKYFLGVKAASV
jgi:hypothetical protein